MIRALNITDWTVLLWWLYAMGRAWLDTTYPCGAPLLRATEMLLLYAVARLVCSRWRRSGQVVAMAVVAFAAVEAVVAVSQLWQGESHHPLYAMTGTFQNPAPFATALAMGLATLCAWAVARCGRPLRWRDLVLSGRALTVVVCVAAAVLAALLCASGSRAALLAAVACLLYVYRRRWWRVRWALAGAAVVLLVMLYLAKPASVWGRGFFGAVAWEAVREHPVVGWGIGSFFHQYAEAMARFSLGRPTLDFGAADVVTYPFNAFLHIGVEEGLVGVAFACCVTLRLLCGLWREARVLFFPAAVLVAVAQVSYPLSLPEFQVAFVLLAACSARPLPVEGRRGAWRVAVAGVALCLLAAPLAREETRRAEVAKDYDRVAGLTSAAFLPDYYNKLEDMGDNSDFLFNFAMILREQRRWNDSNEMLRRGALVSADPMFAVLRGRNLESMGRYDAAAAAYSHAFAQMPNRLYPLYRLLKLHEARGQQAEARSVAHRLLRLRPKVPTAATRQMRREAQAFLDKTKNRTLP